MVAARSIEKHEIATDTIKLAEVSARELQSTRINGSEAGLQPPLFPVAEPPLDFESAALSWTANRRCVPLATCCQ